MEFRQGTFEVVLNDEPDRGIGTIRMIDGANYVNSPVFTIGPHQTFKESLRMTSTLKSVELGNGVVLHGGEDLSRI